MAFSLSPSVDIKETDLTLIVPAVASSIGAFSGVFNWGPVNEPIFIDSEKTLTNIFNTPDDETAKDFLTAASFLSYSNNLRVTRIVGTAARNAFNGTGTQAPVIENKTDYEDKINSLTDIKWIAKYPGTLGNSLKISFADSKSFKKWDYKELFGSSITVNKTGTVTDNSNVVSFTLPETVANLEVGMVVVGDGIPPDTEITNIDGQGNTITLSNNVTVSGTSPSEIFITFISYSGVPGTSAYVESKGGSNDEIHVVIVDEDGFWTGEAGYVLEYFKGLSKARDAKDYTGATSYYVDFLNRNSRYVWFGGTHEKADWGSDSSTNFSSIDQPASYSLDGGVSDNSSGVTMSERIRGYEFFRKSEAIDISLVIATGLDTEEEQLQLAKYIIENIVEYRKDCIALISPPKEAVVNNKDKELQSIVNFRNKLPSSSYAVLDSGWKLMYDRYNDQMRWVPFSGDIAGLCAYTDYISDPWFSPAGYNRGLIKNVIKLAYNPGSKSERDTLYLNNVNPVLSQIGEGVVLFGDKTLQAKPSAFDRINVRRLFIVLEKAIATASKYQLFEFNDVFTRSRFVSMIEPYLRDVKGRRGIYDFRIVCDESNNTPQVIDSNGFVADIYIKPARSINFIQLNFIATPTGISFEELI